MADTAKNTDSTTVLTVAGFDHGLSIRVFRTMAVATGLAVSISAFVAPWRFTAGLLIGGLLSLFNHRWLQSSIATAFGVLLDGQKPRITLGKYVFRYLVIGATVFCAYKLRVASLPALVAGLSSFVVALFLEALRELYFAIIRREEIG